MAWRTGPTFDCMRRRSRRLKRQRGTREGLASYLLLLVPGLAEFPHERVSGAQISPYDHGVLIESGV